VSKLVYERTRDALEQLNLLRAIECLDALLDRAGNGELTTLDVLDQMLTLELAARRERSITARLKLAGLPAVKTLEQFDFGFQPSLDERKIRDLHTLRFLGNGENVIFLGPPGCGKTHLSITLGYAAITAGELVHFTTARDLFGKLRSSERTAMHFKRLAANRAKLLIIDEIGYEPLDRVAAAHFFRLICERYEHGSIILRATNASAIGASSSATKPSPAQSSIGCFTTLRRLVLTAQATGSKTNGAPVSSMRPSIREVTRPSRIRRSGWGKGHRRIWGFLDRH
jgi:DNA replication protein DnaC